MMMGTTGVILWPLNWMRRMGPTTTKNPKKQLVSKPDHFNPYSTTFLNDHRLPMSLKKNYALSTVLTNFYPNY